MNYQGTVEAGSVVLRVGQHDTAETKAFEAAPGPASTVVHTDDIAWSQAMFDWTDLLIGGFWSRFAAASR